MLKTVTAPKGTPVPLMLMTPLESGGSDVGQSAALVVAEDVAVEGVVVVPKGAPVQALVTQSRGAGALSGLMNQPARLEIEFTPTMMGAKAIVLSAEPDSEKPGPYALTRDNTGKAEPSPKIEEALADEATKALLQELSKAIEAGEVPPDLGSRLQANPRLQALLGELGGDTRAFVEKSENAARGYQRLLESSASLRRGKLSGLALGELGLALAAIEELGSLVGDVQRTLKGIFKGRNIRAHVGTRVPAYLHEPLSVTVER